MSSPNHARCSPAQAGGHPPHPRVRSRFTPPAYLGVDTRGRSPLRSCTATSCSAANPDSGKSVALGNIVSHAALCTDVDLVLIDGKLVELVPYAPIAKEFVDNNIGKGLKVLRDLQSEMDKRYLHLAQTGPKKITPKNGYRATLLAIDELAYFSVTVGTPEQQKEFVTLVRELVARGRLQASSSPPPSVERVDPGPRVPPANVATASSVSAATAGRPAPPTAPRRPRTTCSTTGRRYWSGQPP